MSQSILQEAESLTNGDRRADYGHPIEDFQRTARIWSAILGVDVTPQQVALCMAGLKISRECHKPKRDNRVDAAGYFNCLDMIQTRIEEQGIPKSKDSLSLSMTAWDTRLPA